MKSRITTAFILFTLWFPLRSQDIHFTLYDMMPVVFNPAETGNFYGTFRVSGIYRDQWVAVTGFPDEFKTPSLSVDLPIIKGFRDQDWVGVGGFFYSDRSGTLGLVNNAFKLSAAYHLGLNKKGTTVISLGYQTGSVGRRISQNGIEKIRLESNNFGQDPGGPTNDPAITGELSRSYLDHVGGLHFRSKGRTTLFQAGVSVGNIGNPDASLLGGGGGGGGGGQPNPRVDSPLRIIGHGSFRFLANDRLAWHPSAFVQFLGPAREITAQWVAEYLLNPEKQLGLRGGLGYRFGDAIQLIVGMDIKDEWKFTLGYDINVSDLTPASNAIGGFELSAIYIGKIYKRPDPEPTLFCPRF